MGRLRVDFDFPTGWQKPSARTPLLVVLLAALLPVAAVAAVAGRALWRRQRSRPRRHPSSRAGSPAPEELRWLQGATFDGAAKAQPSPAALPDFPRFGKRARLRELLGQALQAEGQAGQAAALLVPGGGLAHRLSAAGGSAAPSPAWGVPSSGGDSDSNRWSGAGPASARTWALMDPGLDSLRLMPGELEASHLELRNAVRPCACRVRMVPRSRPARPCAASHPQITMQAGDEPVVVGEGAHAVVYLGRLQGQPVAVKVRGWQGSRGAASAESSFSRLMRWCWQQQHLSHALDCMHA